ncbi:MAG: TetR/AcrR family transcriptional regulator [Balneolaceae bacterium]|nr:TetR/AcrR family transcriptional regulator [Balneolaceae bacterium]
MTKNPVHKRRMKNYFLEAAKEIIMGEGVSALSVRNVAERAGYSYATLYSYYRGLTDLISSSLNDFKEECIQHIHEKTEQAAPGKENIEQTVMAYVQYFVQYPSIYRLFYIEKLPSGKTTEIAAFLLDELYQDDFQLCIKGGVYTKKEAVNIKERLRYTVSGLLVLYLNRKHPGDYQTFTENVQREVSHILDRSES